MTTTPTAQQRIEIFRTGRHTDGAGVQMSFADADLAGCATAYDPALHEAPLCVGHPKHDLPAYGWVRGLQAADGVLYADTDQVDPAFAELVRTGRFKKRSASFYLPDSPSNPKPGTLYLRHVAFLGAQPPAVKGLRDVAFSDTDEGVVEFGDWDDQQVAKLFTRMREWLIGKFGLEEADKALPSWQVDSVIRAAMAPEPQATEAAANPLSYSDEGASVTTPTPAQVAQQAVLDARQAQLDARQAEIDSRDLAARQAARLTEFREFTGGLVRAGQLLPVQQERLVAVLGALPEAQVLDFAEGTTTIKARPAVDALREFLAGLPKQVEFKELAAGGGGDGDETDSGISNREAADRAVAFQEKQAVAGVRISVTQALDAVHQGKDRAPAAAV